MITQQQKKAEIRGANMKVVLNANEMEALLLQEPATEKRGGYQSLMIRLQGKLDASSGELDLNSDDLEKIPRYAFDYQDGGWQDRLVAIFGRTLGAKLGR